MTDSSRLTTSADALATVLHALAEALAQARPDDLATSQAAVEAGALAFRAAVAESAASGLRAAPDLATAVTGALMRCRRLGLSLSLLAGPTSPSADAPLGYTPVGRLVSSADGTSLLTARG